MTDFDVIREWLMDEWTTWERENRTPENNQALAALSRVETELAEAREAGMEQWAGERRRAEAAEAERDSLSRQLDAVTAAGIADHDRALAAEARVKSIEAYLMEPPEKLRERAVAAESERDELRRGRIRAEEAARVSTALMEGAQQACGDLRARAQAAEAEVARLRHAAESYIETIRNPLNGPPARQEAIDALAAALAAPTKEDTDE